MDKFKNWWKEDNRYLTAVKAGLAALLPILCCMVSCAVQGKTIGEVYLPVSEWNDELFYYKQVEAILEYGYPQGYFGFNESHALKLSFAAWSPVLVWPWLLWGFLFGWNLMSPILCNIVLMTVAMFVFVWLAKPGWKQMGILTLLFCLYTPFVRFMLSGMPEVICFSMLIIFLGLVYSYLAKEKTGKLVCLFFLSGMLVLMRPYLLLFMLLPVYFWFKKSRWKGLVGSGVVVLSVMAIYVLINRYLGAEYFTPLFYTEWITTFFTQGIGAGIRNLIGTLYYMGKGFMTYAAEGFRSGLAAGAYFLGFLVIMGILLWQSLADWREAKKQNEPAGLLAQLAVEAHMAFAFVAMLFALLLMYKLTEGSRHLLTFMAAAIFVISMMRTKYYKKAVLVGATFAYLYSYMAVDPYNYQVPFADEKVVAQVEYWGEVFAEHLELVEEDVPNYDNVIIWTLGDITAEGWGMTKWQNLYRLPDGFGVSCCLADYITANLESLESRYIATVVGGTIDGMCSELGYREIARDTDMVVYERY